MNPWVEFIRTIAKRLKVSYPCALSQISDYKGEYADFKNKISGKKTKSINELKTGKRKPIPEKKEKIFVPDLGVDNEDEKLYVPDLGDDDEDVKKAIIEKVPNLIKQFEKITESEKSKTLGAPISKEKFKKLGEFLKKKKDVNIVKQVETKMKKIKPIPKKKEVKEEVKEEVIGEKRKKTAEELDKQLMIGLNESMKNIFKDTPQEYRTQLQKIQFLNEALYYKKRKPEQQKILNEIDIGGAQELDFYATPTKYGRTIYSDYGDLTKNFNSNISILDAGSGLLSLSNSFLSSLFYDDLNIQNFFLCEKNPAFAKLYEPLEISPKVKYLRDCDFLKLNDNIGADVILSNPPFSILIEQKNKYINDKNGYLYFLYKALSILKESDNSNPEAPKIIYFIAPTTYFKEGKGYDGSVKLEIPKSTHDKINNYLGTQIPFGIWNEESQAVNIQKITNIKDFKKIKNGKVQKLALDAGLYRIIPEFIFTNEWDATEGSGLGPKIRRDFKPEIRDLLAKVGNRKITSITLQRVPIESMLKGVLNFLTMGKYKETTEKLGYDKIFHLSMIVTLEGLNSPLVVEKNEVINISSKIPPMKQGGARLSVPVNKDITLNELLKNAESKMGNRFYLYDAFNQRGGGNCQDFIYSLLKYSNLSNPQAEKFILQDAKAIVRGLPIYTSYVTRGLTDLGAQFDRIIYGKGK